MGVLISDCESVFHCTPTAHTDVFVGGDKFAAALESRVTQFELYDGVRLLLFVIIGDERPTSEPQKIRGALQMDAREFFQPVAAQSMQTH